ncbi:MAG TPA: PDZ domain-containing protein [Pyrinomonadaceae bacterium]|nr:PDZ domain-containing protein [Pyrinomonadaceae bacterium]
MTWILLGLAALFIAGFLISTLRKQRPLQSRNQTQSVIETSLGVSELVNANDGGVTFFNVYPPDSPADKAGLVGGDVLTACDGHAVRNIDDLVDLLGQAPAGKKVEVMYVRDGETRKALLTTISPDQFELLADNFEKRSTGYGSLGFQDTEKVVPVAGKNLSGVKMNTLSPSGPAALAGIQTGDVVIEFDGVPIRNRGEFLMRVRRAIPYSTVNVVVVRGTQQLQIPVKMGKR